MAPPPPIGDIFNSGLIPKILPGKDTPALGGGGGGGFNFGAGGFGAPVAGAGGGGEDEEEGGDGEDGKLMDEPERIARNKEDTDEYIIEQPCKLRRLRVAAAEGGGAPVREWLELGKGVIRVTRDAATGKKRLLVRNTMGKITLNAAFYPQQRFDAVPGDKKRSSVLFGAFAEVQEYKGEGDKAVMVKKMGVQSFMLVLKPEMVGAVLEVVRAAVAEVGTSGGK